MPSIRQLFIAILTAAGLSVALLAAESKPAAPSGPYTNDFSNLPLGKLGKEFFVLGGAFAVAEADGNKCLELAGNPLDTSDLLFGPEALTACDVSARVYATNDGKLFPEFGIGANDAAGWKLWAMPGQNALVIRKQDNEVARVPLKWTSGQWLSLHLQVLAGPGEKWTVSGKAWPASEKEPEAWSITTTDTAKPPAGRASLWGLTYSGTPIRFDDLAVSGK